MDEQLEDEDDQYERRHGGGLAISLFEHTAARVSSYKVYVVGCSVHVELAEIRCPRSDTVASDVDRQALARRSLRPAPPKLGPGNFVPDP